MLTTTTVYDALHRNGIIIERARRAGRSLTKQERLTVAAGRDIAADKCLTKHQMQTLEMEGERDWTEVLKPLRVVAVFAYFDDPYEELPATPHYVVRESNHPKLPVHGHIGATELGDAGMPIPKTPTYEAWVAAGRKVVRK